MIHQVMVPSVSLCKTRTYEPQRQEQSVVQQIREHVEITIRGEIIIDFRYDVLKITVKIIIHIQNLIVYRGQMNISMSDIIGTRLVFVIIYVKLDILLIDSIRNYGDEKMIRKKKQIFKNC